jgi:hypothetical protein
MQLNPSSTMYAQIVNIKKERVVFEPQHDKQATWKGIVMISNPNTMIEKEAVMISPRYSLLSSS